MEQHQTSQKIGALSLLVREYDEAIRFFTGVLGFELLEDIDLGNDKRWVMVAPQGEGNTCLLLARAVTPEQSAHVGNQTGGRVFMFLYTSDFDTDYVRFKAAGVRFLEPPRHESYGIVAVFIDLYGNKWDLLQLADV